MSQATAVPLEADDRVAQMRAEFDSAFARPPAASAAELTDVLTLRVGEQPCMVRLSDIAEVSAQPVLTAVPTPIPELLGIAARRGSPVAAYDLGLLLGRAPVAPRWLILAAAEPGIGLVFEHFDGYRRIPLGPEGSEQLIEMAALIQRITRLANHRSSNQEIDS
jgi:purine-binding chemotaxis protein CheW